MWQIKGDQHRIRESKSELDKGIARGEQVPKEKGEAYNGARKDWWFDSICRQAESRADRWGGVEPSYCFFRDDLLHFVIVIDNTDTGQYVVGVCGLCRISCLQNAPKI